MTGNVGTNVGDFHPGGGFDGHSEASLDREPLEGISRVEDMYYDVCR